MSDGAEHTQHYAPYDEIDSGRDFVVVGQPPEPIYQYSTNNLSSGDFALLGELTEIKELLKSILHKLL